MKLSQLEKVQKLYNKVKELDAEIIELEKAAQTIALKKTDVKFTMTVDVLDKAQEKESVLDADGSLINRAPLYYTGMLWGLVGPPREPEKPNHHDIAQSMSIPDRVALRVIAVLIADKMEIRELAIHQLSKHGIEI